MAAQGAPPVNSQGADSALLADNMKRLSGGDGGGEQTDFADFIAKALAGKLASLPAKAGLKVNASDPENAAPTKAIDSQGLQDKNFQGLLSMVDSNGGVIWNAVKTLVADRTVKDWTSGVGGEIYSMVAAHFDVPKGADNFVPLPTGGGQGASIEIS